MIKLSKEIKLWQKSAVEISEPNTPSVPLNVLLEEGTMAAHFVSRYWKEKGNRPGLRQAGAEVSEQIATEILGLCRAVQETQTHYLRLSEEKGDTKETSDRARFLLREFKHVAKWAFRVEGAELARKRLGSVRASYRNKPKKAANLASELRDYIQLISEHLELVTGIGSFDEGLIVEARTIAKKLHGIRPGRPPKSKACGEILLLRRQLTHLLMERVRLVRTAARFIFRNHRSIVLEITSNYERKRRFRSRERAEVT
jgi:chorismate mutase